MTNTIVVDVHISAEDYLRYYSGSARNVLARARDGRNIRFPANILQRFVTREGIHGCFQIHFDAAGKFRAVERLD